MNMSTKIYLVENIEPGTNKVYIGKTKNNTRYYGHQSKYGLQIKYTIIDEINSLNHNDWEPLETKWIQHYIDLGYDVINKRKKGGSGPISHTNETKQKISKGKIGHECYSSIERSNKISKALQNHSKHYTEDIIQKMKKPKPKDFGKRISKALKGRSRPDIKGRVSPNKGKTKKNE